MQRFKRWRVVGRAEHAFVPALIVASGLLSAAVYAWHPAEQPARMVFAPQPTLTPVAFSLAPARLPAPSVAYLAERFDALGYSLARVRNGETPVPRVLPDAVPGDMPDVADPQERKRLFLRMTLPMVLVVNERIQQDRNRVLRLRRTLETGSVLSARDQVWLSERFREYSVRSGDFGTLLRRLDGVPASLALAQAAIESGWGTSRFAREGNALFGQWTTEEYYGLVPKKRAVGKSHKVRAFRDPFAAVASYLRNLNTHPAYRSFRERRSEMRATGRDFDAMALADTLTAYSEKGDDYVRLVRQVMRTNNLTALDKARLAPERPRIATQDEAPQPRV